MKNITQVEIWMNNVCRFTAHTNAKDHIRAARNQAKKAGITIINPQYVTRTVPDHSSAK